MEGRGIRSAFIAWEDIERTERYTLDTNELCIMYPLLERPITV